MMLKKLTGLGLFLCVSLGVSAFHAGGDGNFPKLKGWKLEESSTVYTPDNLWDLINGAAESYNAYDFVDLHLADYSNKKGTVIHAELYRHSNLSNAFGIYSSERSPGYNFLDIGAEGYLDEGVLNCFAGPYYMKFYSTGSGEEVQEALKTVAKAVSGHIGQADELPPLLEAMPLEGKVEHEDKYINENFIGFSFLHTAFTAEYDGGYRLFVIKGRDREEILEMAAAYLKFTKQEIDPEEKKSFIITDRYNGDIPVVLLGGYMAGIIDGADSDEAKAKLDKLVKNLAE